MKKNCTKCNDNHKHNNNDYPLNFIKTFNRPPPPKLNYNFCWSGNYFVPDLNINLPFTWHAENGNMQMIAGNNQYPIWFTNLIYNGFLYTLTYKWPGLPPDQGCDKIIPFTIDDLNTIFATSSFVGFEILEHNNTSIRVHHFRLSIVLPRLPPGKQFRIPITSADIYVDYKDPTKIFKILHFGLQNLFDPNLDEWIIINNFRDVPGNIVFPCKCNSPNPSGLGLVQFIKSNLGIENEQNSVTNN